MDHLKGSNIMPPANLKIGEFMIFTEFFSMATGWPPYSYQIRMAESPELPVLLRIPTGTGKTEAAVLAWLYRHFNHPDQKVRDLTPRRLVYCLPMRTLVEQTVKRIERWLTNLSMTDRVSVTTLMGGEPRERWYLYPEKPFIVVGTQDMLLSRALNRGLREQPLHVAGGVRPTEQRLSLGSG